MCLCPTDEYCYPEDKNGYAARGLVIEVMSLKLDVGNPVPLQYHISAWNAVDAQCNSMVEGLGTV